MEPFREFHEIASNFSPSIDVTENDTEVLVTAELPGIDEKELEIDLNEGYLTIKGKKKDEKD